MAVIDPEKGVKVNVSEAAHEDDEDKSEFAYLRPADLSLWKTLWQSLKTIASNSDSSHAVENDGLDKGFEQWVHNRYKKRILYRYNKDFVLDVVALQSMCMQFRLKRISEQAFNIITSTPENVGPLCKNLEGELGDYTAALRDMEYMNKFGLTSNVKDPFTITTETTSQQAMLRHIWTNLLNPDSEDCGTAKESKQELKRLLCSEQKSIPKPLDRKKQFETSQQPDYWFRRKALRKYIEVFALAVVGNLFLIGPMILMVLKPGLITSLVTTSICVTIFAAVAPKFLDKIGDVMSATAAYAAVLVVFVGTSGGGASV